MLMQAFFLGNSGHLEAVGPHYSNLISAQSRHGHQQTFVNAVPFCAPYKGTFPLFIPAS